MPTASNLTHASIDTYANKVSHHYNIYNEHGQADIPQLLSSLGGDTEIARNDKAMLVEKHGAFTIYIPQHTSHRRDRLMTAHAIGHYFLHYLYPDITETIIFRCSASKRMEIEANLFAASLLMPRSQFTTEWSRTGGDARETSRIFNVSPRAAEVRAEMLGLDNTPLLLTTNS